jgi:hypothetical protein
MEEGVLPVEKDAFMRDEALDVVLHVGTVLWPHDLQD